MGIGKGMSFLLIVLAVMALSGSTTQSSSMARTSGVTPVSVIFTSLQSTFTADLRDPSSSAFKNRALMIKAQLEPKFKATLLSYRSMLVELFRNGTVINELKLMFDNTSVPTNAQIANVMVNASRSVKGFDIVGSTIYVNGFASSGIVHSSSLVTASCLTLLSYLLSSQR